MADELILTISGEDGHLGDRDIPFVEKYTVNCDQEVDITVTETLDGVLQIRTYTAGANTEQQADINISGLSQGEHTLTITAAAGGGSVTRTYTFTLPVTYLRTPGADLGSKIEAFTIPYMAKTYSGVELAVTEKVDGEVIREYTAVSGEEQTMTVKTEKLTDREHRAEIIVTGDGETKSAELTFSVAPIVLADGGTVQEFQDGNGDPVYPATIAKAVMTTKGESVEQVLAEAEQVGDIKITARTDLGDDWLLCNGVKVSREAYEKLSELFVPNPLEEWDEIKELGINAAINCITYANGYWAVGVGAKVAYTTDLTGDWTVKEIWSIGNIYCITYTDGLWVVGGEKYANSTYYAEIAYTTDLTGDWTSKTVWSNGDKSRITCIAYANGHWVVGGQRANLSTYDYYAIIAYATDMAGTWTTKDLWHGAIDTVINCVAYADGRWVVGGLLDGTISDPVRIAYAANPAETWTIKDIWKGSYGRLNCITYTDGLWVIGGRSYIDGKSCAGLAYTQDPTGDWTTINPWAGDSTSNLITCIAHEDGYWFVGGVALASDNTTRACFAYTQDIAGEWEKKDLWGESPSINGIAYGDGCWAIGGAMGGTSKKAIVSYYDMGLFLLPTMTADKSYVYIKAKE